MSEETISKIRESAASVKAARGKRLDYALYYDAPDYYAELIRIADKDDPAAFETAFVKYDKTDGTTAVVPSLDFPNRIVMPFPPEHSYLIIYKQSGDVEEYGDTLELVKELCVFLNTWIDMEERYLKIVAFYILLTYIYDSFLEVPYLHITGDLSKGKSRLAVDLLGSLCFRPIVTIGVSSIASLMRVMQGIKGTLIIDEFELRSASDKTSEVTQMLNASYKKDIAVFRCDVEGSKGKKMKVETFDLFGPKILVSRGPLKDDALNSRCLPILLNKTSRDDISLLIKPALARDALALRNKLLLWRFRNRGRTVEDADQSFGQMELTKRVAQLFALMSIVTKDDPDMFAFLKSYAEEIQREATRQRGDSLVGNLVAYLHSQTDETVQEKYTFLVPDIMATLNEDSERKLTSNYLSRFLRRELQIESYRYGHANIRKFDVSLEHLNELFGRYGFEKITVPEGLETLLKPHE